MSSPKRENNEEKKRNKPSPVKGFGGLPASIDDMKQVTTETGLPVVHRRVGGPAMMPPSPFGPMSSMPGPMGMSPQSFGHMGGGLQTFQAPASKTAPSLSVATESEKIWNVTDESIQTLPECHPLERSSCFVPHTSASVVASRVVNILCTRSISATFDADKAKAKCFTREGVEFRVFLYRGKNTYSHGIIVEVQRRDGFSFNFHTDTRAILDGAQGKETPPPAPLSPPCLVSSDVESYDGDDDDDDDSFCPPPSLSSLKIASNMLASNNVDTNCMALDGLASMTDSSKMGKAAAARNSTEILSSNSSVSGALVNFILKKPEPVSNHSFGDLIDSDDEDEGETFEERAQSMRLTALTVLSNVSSNAKDSRPLLAAKGAVVPALVQDIKNAKTNPRAADLAVRSLIPQIKAMDRFYVQEELIGDFGLMELLMEAREIGGERYAALAESTRSCLDALDASR